MKRKEIARYLDEVGNIATKSLSDESDNIVDVALVGFTVDIAVSVGIISGELEPHTPEIDALIAKASIIELLNGDDDD